MDNRHNSPAPFAIRPIGRIPVMEVQPVLENGLPVVSVSGKPFPVTARVFRDGHDAVNATVVVTSPFGKEQHFPMRCTSPGLDTWEATISADTPGMWSYRVEGWSDPYATWCHDADIKVKAGVDVEIMLTEGAQLLERAAQQDTLSVSQKETLLAGTTGLLDSGRPPLARLAAGLNARISQVLAACPYREMVSPSANYPWLVERPLALTGAWYEIFPRSEGATYDKKTDKWTSGTLKTAAERLPAIAKMGFDIVYLTPVHPIGITNRKGPNNTLNAGPDDPGSPYAIGSKDGGHDAIHPELGDFTDFTAFVNQAHKLGLEVAMDLALQCSPDHPWVEKHPEWFTTRADGSIAYAENPPKKYQDIYPLNFDNDPAGIYAEVRRVVQVWIDHGVTLFRVDNPHTKPLEFWQWLIADVAKDHPEIIWLSEAFTRPAMMHTLAKIGFQQSYTYFTWRNEAHELRRYCEKLAGPFASYMRPAFWPTTHDILTPYMQFGGPNAWKLRSALAALLVPTYGIYSGYELIEHVARPDAEEQIDNEKYQFKDRQWWRYEPGGPNEGQSLAGWLQLLNTIRREHPALHHLRNLRFHEVDDENFLVFSKRRITDSGAEDLIIVVANLDPHSTRETTVHFDMEALGRDHNARMSVTDLVTKAHWNWGRDTYVRLGIDAEPVHIVTLNS